LLPDLVAFNALGSAAAVSGQWLLMLRLMEDATKMRLQCDAITGRWSSRSGRLKVVAVLSGS